MVGAGRVGQQDVVEKRAAKTTGQGCRPGFWIEALLVPGTNARIEAELRISTKTRGSIWMQAARCPTPGLLSVGLEGVRCTLAAERRGKSGRGADAAGGLRQTRIGCLSGE